MTKIKEGSFRQDLYYRIAQRSISIPALRERDADVWLLADHFLKQELEEEGKGRNLKFAPEAKRILRSYSFPGNVRQLKNVVNYAVAHSKGELIRPLDLPDEVTDEDKCQSDHDGTAAIAWPEWLFNEPQRTAVELLENSFNREYLRRKYEQSNHSVPKAADASGMTGKTFRAKWEKAIRPLPPLPGARRHK